MDDLSRTQKKALRIIRHRGPSTAKSLVNALGVGAEHLRKNVLNPLVRQGLLRKTVEGGRKSAWYETESP